MRPGFRSDIAYAALLQALAVLAVLLLCSLTGCDGKAASWNAMAVMLWTVVVICVGFPVLLFVAAAMLLIAASIHDWWVGPKDGAP